MLHEYSSFFPLFSAYLNSGCHVEIFAQESAAKIKKEASKEVTKKTTRKAANKTKLAIGH